MRVPLVTHALLWSLIDDSRLSPAARRLIENPVTEVAVSLASYREMAIKIGKRNYTLPEPCDAFMMQEPALNDFRILPVEIHYTNLLTAQSLVDDIPIVTVDAAFNSHGVSRIW